MNMMLAFVMWFINARSKVKIHNHLCDKTQFVGTMITRDKILKITGNGTKSDHTECYLDTNELSTILMIPVAQHHVVLLLNVYICKHVVLGVNKAFHPLITNQTYYWCHYCCYSLITRSCDDNLPCCVNLM